MVGGFVCVVNWDVGMIGWLNVVGSNVGMFSSVVVVFGSDVYSYSSYVNFGNWV